MSLFNKICYTNKNKGDFRAESLPRTRTGVFKDAVKNKFTTLFTANALFLLFMIPLAAVLFFGNVFGSAYLANAVANENVNRIQAYYNAYRVMFLALIPAIGVAGIGGGGLMYVLRNLAWRECAFVARTFFAGIKKSVKQTFKGFLLLGAFVYALFTLMMYAAGMGKAGVVLVCVLAVFSIFVFASYLFYLPQAVLYDCGTFTILRNCVLLAAAKLPSVAGMLLLLAVTNIGIGLLGSVGQFVCILYNIVCGFSVGGLAATLYAHSVFDVTLNKPFPEIIGKGLYRDEEETKRTDEKERFAMLTGFPSEEKEPNNFQEELKDGRTEM